MRCRKCGREAVIHMRQHKLALCEVCFPTWVQERVAETIRRYRMFGLQDRILVAVSGGKDSLSLWDVLLALGYQADGLYIDLGIGEGGYSRLSREKAEAFARAHGAALWVESVPERYGESVPQVAMRRHRRRKVCSICGLIKRHIMNRVARDGGYDVIATGHNLDDEAAVLLGNVLQWSAGYLQRQAPVLPADQPGLARKVKPLCTLYEREMAAYALVRGIDYIYDECPYAVGAKSLFYKDLLNQLEERSPGAKQNFYTAFLRAREQGEILFRDEARTTLQPCRQCGQPTSAEGLCAFCRLWVGVEERR
ncbi:MAG: ATP-binding protein [Anaerolineae bacterium]